MALAMAMACAMVRHHAMACAMAPAMSYAMASHHAMAYAMALAMAYVMACHGIVLSIQSWHARLIGAEQMGRSKKERLSLASRDSSSSL